MLTRRRFLAASPALLAAAPQPLHFGVIRAGGRGRKPISLIQGLGPRARLAAIADPDPARLARAAKLARSLVPPPREIRCAGEDLIQPPSARMTSSEGVPAAARRALANDPKDAEVVARGFRALREYVAGPARYRSGKFDDEIREKG